MNVWYVKNLCVAVKVAHESIPIFCKTRILAMVKLQTVPPNVLHSIHLQLKAQRHQESFLTGCIVDYSLESNRC